MIEVKIKVQCFHMSSTTDATEGVLKVKSLGSSGMVLLESGDIVVEVNGRDLLKAIANALNT